MTDINWDNIRRKIEEALEDKVFPGGVLHVLHEGKTLFKECFGVRDYIDKEAVTLSTVYDLASLTKPLSTTLALMDLYGNKKIDIDKPLSFYIKDVVGDKKNF
jgi:CubicO group peptidase (beta-lactamase class C family)